MRTTEKMWVNFPTRIQVFNDSKLSDSSPSFFKTASQLYREEGLKGFMRGVIPRMTNVAMWGTCMVTAYEFLSKKAVFFLRVLTY